MKLQGKAERSHLIVWQVLANEDWGLNSDPGFDLPFSLNSAAMQEEFRWTTSLCRHEFDQHFFSSSHLNNKSETSKNCSESYSVVNWTGAVQTDSTACYRFILSCLLLFVLFLYIYILWIWITICYYASFILILFEVKLLLATELLVCYICSADTMNFTPDISSSPSLSSFIVCPCWTRPDSKSVGQTWK